MSLDPSLSIKALAALAAAGIVSLGEVLDAQPLYPTLLGAAACVFLRMMEGLASAEAEPKTIMIDATYLKAHPTASSQRVKVGALDG